MKHLNIDTGVVCLSYVMLLLEMAHQIAQKRFQF